MLYNYESFCHDHALHCGTQYFVIGHCFVQTLISSSIAQFLCQEGISDSKGQVYPKSLFVYSSTDTYLSPVFYVHYGRTSLIVLRVRPTISKAGEKRLYHI